MTCLQREGARKVGAPPEGNWNFEKDIPAGSRCSTETSASPKTMTTLTMLVFLMPREPPSPAPRGFISALADEDAPEAS